MHNIKKYCTLCILRCILTTRSSENFLFMYAKLYRNVTCYTDYQTRKSIKCISQLNLHSILHYKA